MAEGSATSSALYDNSAEPKPLINERSTILGLLIPFVVSRLLTARSLERDMVRSQRYLWSSQFLTALSPRFFSGYAFYLDSGPGSGFGCSGLTMPSSSSPQ